METDKMLKSPGLPSKHKNIVRKDGISATSNLINFVCGMIGPGAFSVAMSFKQAGLWSGFLLVFLMGGLSLLSMYKIIQCSQRLALVVGDQFLDYGDMAREACRHSYDGVRRWANVGKWIVNGCLIAFQLGVISVCFVFVAEHILEVLDYFFGPDHGFTKLQLILIYFVPQLCVNFIGNIRAITVLSLFGNVIIFAAALLISKELFLHERQPSSSLPAFTDFNGIAMAAGALIYAFEGQAMVLPLENRLRHPSDMLGLSGVLCTAMNFVMIIYAFIGFFGYLTFGANTQGSLTLNLDDSILSIAVKCLLVAKIFVGSALQLYVVVVMIWPPLQKRFFPDEKSIGARTGPYVVRTLLMLVSLTVAVSVPNLYDIIPLVGITSGMLLSLIIPAVLDSLVFLPVIAEQKSAVCEIVVRLVTNAVLFSLGWFFLITGLYSNIMSIMSRE